MRGHISYKALIAGMTAVAISAGTVLAQSQQVPAGLQMTLDVLQRFSAGDNLSRTETPTDNGVLSTTKLTFGLTSQTRGQDLSLKVGADARMGHLPDEGGRINELTNPFLDVAYVRRGADSRLTFDAGIREIDLRDQVLTVDTGLELIDLTIDNGTRKQEQADLRLVSGTGGPVETDLRLRWAATTFDSTDASLLDEDRLQFNGSVKLAVTRNADLILGLDMQETKTYDTTTRTVDTLRYRVGATTEVRPGTELTLVLGSSTIDTVEGASSTSDSATTARASVTHDMPNGEIGFSYDRTHSTAGTRDNLTFSRSLELPSGVLDFAIGTTKSENADARLLADIAYRQQFKRGTLLAQVQQRTNANTEGDEFSNTTASLRYIHQLSELVQLDFNLQRTQVEQIAGGGTEERERSVASLAFNYDLTADWAMSAGYRHENQSTDGTTTLESNEVFATFNRSFDLRF